MCIDFCDKPTAQSISGKMTLRITCDDEIQELYLDGEQKIQDVNFQRYRRESTVETSDKLTVIAVKCVNTGGGAGMLASLENEMGETVFYTDTNWKCSTVLEEDWQLPMFQATTDNWQNAIKTGDHSQKIGQISSDADWIWAVGKENTVYCRGADIVAGKFLISSSFNVFE